MQGNIGAVKIAAGAGRARRRGRRCRGFTLLEVLVAFTILALTLTVLLRVFASGTRGVATAGGYGLATTYAQALLATAGVETPLVPGTEEGVWPEGYRWTRTVAAHVADDGGPEPVPLYRVAATVTWEAPSGTRELRLVTLRLADTEVGR